MTPFSAIFSSDFFIYLGFVVLAVAGLVLAISYRRSQEGKVSLFLLLTTALATAYYTLQWLFNSFVVFLVSNYMVSHPDFQVPNWTMIVLNYLVLALNFGGLTAWFAVRKNRAERVVLAQGPEETTTEEPAPESALDVELSGTTGDSTAPAEPPVPGPEA
ncbi:MAG: hypothetical protein NTZ77_07140 [Caldiserica bacterium]|nr:hypothetical protein [Caldisericota bacterium]